MSVCTGRQAGSIRPPMIVPSQGIFHRWDMLCTTDTSSGNHFLPSIVLVSETYSGGPNFRVSVVAQNFPAELELVEVVVGIVYS